ncbi:hypothetical protein [Siccirubricoccus phaeus]|uniref:hypothetical protein n=1 Tax=Siccirubricoccus phaeus TaxID=2595053 RepID=UPI0011F30C1C|nr:hypothetical protein [Siccirubricoccus phaeus]
MRQRRALLATAHFAHVAGSELVLLEAAEALAARGFACEILSCLAEGPMAALAAAAGVPLRHGPAAIRAFDYDLLWLQHRFETLFDYRPEPEARERSLFVFAHLDRSWDFAQPGVLAEPFLADAILVPSEEGEAQVIAAGLPAEKVMVFRNAAPPGFARPAGAPRRALRRLLVVSNHAPPEVLAALPLLRAAGLEVVHWGLGGEVVGQRLTAADLDAADAVLSIGKTVPYALRARLPAFVYDHFGGPGWLDARTLHSAARHHFSGRCCARPLAPEALAAELLEGFPAAAAFAAALPEAALAPFALERVMDALLAGLETAPTAEARRAGLAALEPQLSAERHLAAAAAHYYSEWLWQRRLIAASAPG